MSTVTSLFKNQVRGYDRDQVDSYIQKLTTEYCRLQNQLQELSGKYEQQNVDNEASSEIVAEISTDVSQAIDVEADVAANAKLGSETNTKTHREAQLDIQTTTKKEIEVHRKVHREADICVGGNANVLSEAISRALVDAEVRAIQITSEAENEASRIIAAAKDEVAKITGSAYMELKEIQQKKSSVLCEANELLNKLQGLLPATKNHSALPENPDVPVGWS